ncbi:response regulator [Candidatus Fermentibacteria bacterium]|nr:response regulator [Candidatus Fermentibacteria bacterium]
MRSELETAERASKAESVLVVDDEAGVREVVQMALRDSGYPCHAVSSAREAIELLSSEPVALVITDLRMPGDDGVWLLHQVQEKSKDIAVIMVTAVRDLRIAIDCLKQGAYDYITKPFDMSDMLFSVRRALERRELILMNKEYQRNLEHMVNERTAELHSALDALHATYRETLQALVASLDAREKETTNHSLRVTEYTTFLARQVGIPESEIVQISWGALLHDIGKLGIPDSILLKPGLLDPEEWRIMRRHPTIGHQILKGVTFLDQARELVLCHQEQFSGAGYPNHLKGEEIPLGARVFAVCDTLDAITSNRPYRQARSFEQAYTEMINAQGEQFDPEVVSVFAGVPLDTWKEIRRQSLPPGVTPPN